MELAAGHWAESRADRDPYQRTRDLEAVSNRRRFENMLARHEARLRRVTFGMIGDPGRVDDVLQEALVRAFRALPARFENDAHEAGWLYTIVHRTCLNEIRSRRRRMREGPGLLDQVEAPAVTEDALALAQALATLPNELRAVVLLVDLVGFDYESAAAVIGVPRGTVASRLSAARAQLRSELR